MELIENKQPEQQEQTLQKEEMINNKGGVLDMQIANDPAYKNMYEDSPQNLLLDRMIAVQFHKVEREM
jgi:hypothetical protein